MQRSGGGPMVVLAENESGGAIVLIDPAGVYLAEAVNQADILPDPQTAPDEKVWLRSVQNGDRDGRNHLIYKEGMVKIPLGENSGILTLKTKTLVLRAEERQSLDQYVVACVHM
jgi:hypothetical protein